MATQVSVTDDTLTLELSDGRTISAPLAWYPRLFHATVEERTRWRLIGQGAESTGRTSTKTSASRTCSPASRRARANLRSRNGSDRGRVDTPRSLLDNLVAVGRSAATERAGPGTRWASRSEGSFDLSTQALRDRVITSQRAVSQQ